MYPFKNKETPMNAPEEKLFEPKFRYNLLITDKYQKFARILKSSFLILSILLIAGGQYASTLTVQVPKEQMKQEKVKVENNKDYSIEAAATGGFFGAIAGWAIGGIGIVVMGTGIGIPAGITMLGTSTAMTGVGYGIGSMIKIGDDNYVTKAIKYLTYETVSMFPSWVTTTVTIFGVLLLITSIYMFVKNPKWILRLYNIIGFVF